MNIDLLLEKFDEATRSASYADRALYRILLAYKDDLPVLDSYFHLAFRQTDVTDSGDIDMAIWFLLNYSELFWQTKESLQGEREK